MADLYYDLHIHSCLSPCGDDDMTPANLVGMAAVKGLDVIAVTDHNSCKNCPAVLAAAEEYGILAVPGMEICTSEEVHAVCLFPDLNSAMAFDAYVYERLMPFPNDENIFGKQQIYDTSDRVCATIPYLLINATEISFEGLWELVRSYDGVMFPAHIEKSTNSLISNLGFIPPDSKFRTAEVKDLKQLHALRREHPYLEGCRIISDSDAHYLEDIKEPELTLHTAGRTVQDVIDALLFPEISG
ncbi:MAG: PHP domain-containing protein [Hungatella sp.]